MKKALLFICLFGISFAIFAQNQETLYDSVLAKKLGADDLGMKSYVLAILKTGPAKIENQAVRDSLFRGHFRNINSLADSGYLVVAGPFGKNDFTYRGLFILTTESVEQARMWIERDPTVSSGIFEIIYIPWYGSAALSALTPIHDKISRKRPE